MFNFEALTQWIETHQATVDLLKWLVVLVLAWVVGLFKYLRDLTRKPRLSISKAVSRCLIERHPIENHQDATKSAFLLNIEVANRSSELIVVGSFEIQYQTLRRIRRWSKPVSAVSLPSRVHHKMGAGLKILRNWFAHFPDGLDNLTVEGKIEARDAQSGYALFVTHTFGSWNPRIRCETIRVRVTALLTTGRRVRAQADVVVTENSSFFEETVPGILEQIRDPTAWNAPSRF